MISRLFPVKINLFYSILVKKTQNDMKINFKIFVSSIVILFIVNVAYSQSEIGLGWAKNSVNAPIFRKNSVASFKDNQFVSYYDSLGYVVLAKRKFGADTWEVSKTQYTGNIEDAHCSISIAVDGNGIVHMAWDHHGHPLRYCTSTDSLGLTMGAKKSMVGSLEDVVTYPEFFRMPNGDLTFIYRDGWSGNANCVVNKYNVETKSWTRLHDNLISGESIRSAYWQSCVDKNGVIHVSWVWRETADVASNHDMCYAKSSDGGATWHKSTGEQYTIPITAATAEYICSIPQNSELINQTSVYATAESKPYIASYWTDSHTQRVQYQLIYIDNESRWQQKTFSNRKSTFSLSGGGTKKIPISRPQVMVDDRGDKDIIYMIYRDNDRGSKVSMNVCYDISQDTIQLFEYDLTDFSVDDWEPTYDIDLWKDSLQLDVFVQRMQQGDGETLSDLPAQPVYVWSVKKDSLTPADTIHTPVKLAGIATEPKPEKGARYISTDTTLSWTAGEHATLHKVYLGTSYANMVLVAEVTENYYKPDSLAPNDWYSWRVDEVFGDEVTKGTNWQFKTEELSGVLNNLKDQDFNIYPIPAGDYIFVSNLSTNSQIDIYNLEGKKLISEQTSGEVNISNLNNGAYLLKIDDSRTLKFTK